VLKLADRVCGSYYIGIITVRKSISMLKALGLALIGFSSLAVPVYGQPPLHTAEGWVKDLHTSASVSFGESIVIEAPNNAHAHIERDLSGTEPFRVSAAIKAPAGAHLAPSLFL